MTTPVIIDAVAVAVLAGFAVLGAWKGLLRTLAGLLVVVLSLAGAGIIASALSAPAAKLVAPAIESRLERRLDEALEARRPEELSPADLLDLLGVDHARRDALMERTERAILETGTGLVSALMESLAQSVLYGVLYMIAFVLLAIGLHLLVRMLDAVLRLPGLHGLNAFGGGVLGLLEGALLLFLAVWVLRLLGVSFDGEDSSQIFRFFTTHTPLDVLALLGG